MEKTIPLDKITTSMTINAPASIMLGMYMAAANGQGVSTDKIGGTIHMALGASLPESGGVNESGIHWDIVNDLRGGGTIYADGKVIHKDGKFKI